jgi:hypothetical protein
MLLLNNTFCSKHHLLQLQDQRDNSANKQSSSALYAMGAMQQ